MIILRIEHKIQSYEGWKKVFDSDPINRKKSGVLSYCITQPIDDPNYVIIDLEFDDINKAEAALSALRLVWKQAEGNIMFNPQTKILKAAENLKY